MQGLEFYVKAYQELREPEFISWYNIVKWCEYHGLGKDDSDRVIRFVKALDDERLKYEAKQRD